MIRKATLEDLDTILEIYAYAREQMKKTGNPNQWKDNKPNKETLISDIKNEELYVLVDKDIYGCFMFTLKGEPTYKVIYEGEWLSDLPYGTIHKVASNGTHKGILHQIVEYVSLTTAHLRIDTHHDNKIMQHCILKEGFTYCGIIHLEDGDLRMGYEKIEEA